MSGLQSQATPTKERSPDKEQEVKSQQKQQEAERPAAGLPLYLQPTGPVGGNGADQAGAIGAPTGTIPLYLRGDGNGQGEMGVEATAAGAGVEGATDVAALAAANGGVAAVGVRAMAAAAPAEAGAAAMPAAREGRGAAANGARGAEGKPGEAPAAGAATEAAPAAAPAPAPDPRAAIAPAAAAVQQRAARSRRHPPAAAPVASAQAAAREPDTEQTRAAATQTVKNLDAAEEKEIERQAFKNKLKEAIERATPKPTSEAQADEVMKSGAQKASAALGGELAAQRDAAAGPLAAANSDVPAAEMPAPPESELQAEQVGARPAPVSAAPVVPAPLPPERLDYSSDRAPTDRLMAENEVTSEQMAEGNEPAFTEALGARATAEEHEASVEARYRQSEAEVRVEAEGQGRQALAQGLTGLHSERELRVGQVAEQQGATESKDAAERKRITAEITRIKDKTRSDVTTILDAMKRRASELFDEGLKRAEGKYEEAFEEAKGGVGTWLTTWGSDWERHIENSLATARRRYLSEVDVAIDGVADLVSTKLSEARKRVAAGRKEVENYVNGLDKSVQKFGQEALKAVSADFDAMEADINARRDELINDLAQQYKASYERMSAMEEKLREENKSLWQRVYDATVGVIKKIIAFKNMLLDTLKRAAGVIGDIIAHPIAFLGNLIDGVKLGLDNFIKKIDVHLKKALLEWLFGALAGAGIQFPEALDMKGILSLVMQILGLTYANIRKRAVGILGEEMVSRLEQVAEIFKILITQGPGGLWEFIKEKLSDLKAMVLDAIQNFIIENVIVAGIKWVIGLLNPASAFIKACMAIYDIIKFFVERGSEIVALINAIIDSLGAIVAGNIGGAAKFVEDALARALPLVIGFLAGLLGLGNIGEEIRAIIEKIQAPINTAIDWVIHQAVKLVKAAGKLLGFGKEKPAKEDEVPESDDPEHDAKVEVGLAAIDEEERRYLEGGKIEREEAARVAATVKAQYPIFKKLVVVDGADSWDYAYEASPGKTKKGAKKDTSPSWVPGFAAQDQVARAVALRQRFAAEGANDYRLQQFRDLIRTSGNITKLEQTLRNFEAGLAERAEAERLEAEAPVSDFARAAQVPGGDLMTARAQAAPEAGGASRTPAQAGAKRLPRHHVFPREMERENSFFSQRGFTGGQHIDRFTVEMGVGEHQAIHGGGDWARGREWPNEWNQMIRRELEGAEARKGEMLSFREIWTIVTRQMRVYSIPQDFVPYR